MESRSSRKRIRQFVAGLAPGSRVIWIANGAMGTIQPDQTILWDDGHHMTHTQMNDTHALLIHSEVESRSRQQATDTRAMCVKNGCTQTHWRAEDCKEGIPEQFCPLAAVPELDIPSLTGRRKHPVRATRTVA
jgi:hypothetical protein